MDQITSAAETAQSNPTALPGIAHMQSVTRPQTCDRSATTVPPSSAPNVEDSPVPAQGVPSAALLSALPATTKAPPSTTNLKPQEGASAPPRSGNGKPITDNQADRVSPELAVESQIEESVRKLQKCKRRAPPQGRKTKRPRLGPSQADLKKRTRAPAQKPRQIKSKKTPAARGAPKKGRKTARNTQNAPNESKKASTPLEAAENSIENASNETVKVGSSTDNEGTVSTEKVSNPQPSHSEVGEIKRIEKSSSHPIEKLDGCSARGKSVVTTAVDGRSSGKQNNASQTKGKVTAEAECIEKGNQLSNDVPSSQVDKKQLEGKGSAAIACCDNNRKDSQDLDGCASNGIDNIDNAGSDAQEEEHLREKYEDLSRRYLSLVRGLVQSACDKKGDSGDSENEGSDGRAQTEMVDKKLYDTIYLCKVAGMLGAMKITDGPSNYVRRNRLRGGEDRYKRVLKDGFEFVEDLMKLGSPDENSCASVKAVFRDVHIRLVKDIWERNEDKKGATALLVDMMTMIGEEITVWYMKMMDGEINVLWSELVAIKLVEGLYKNVVRMDEEVSEKFVSCLRGILKYISEYYQACERDVEMASLEKFCYSCEVSISIARSVPEAAISLEEEVAYVIGRHNSVFSHCVSRLVAERVAKDGSGTTTSGR